MAMTAGDADANTGLAGVLFTHLKTLNGANATGTGSPMALFCNQLATAIVGYLQSNATVSPTGLPTPLTAPSSGGPVTGTGVLL